MSFEAAEANLPARIAEARSGVSQYVLGGTPGQARRTIRGTHRGTSLQYSS